MNPPLKRCKPLSLNSEQKVSFIKSIAIIFPRCNYCDTEFDSVDTLSLWEGIRLDLGNNNIGDNVVNNICLELKKCKKIAVLDLSK